MKRINQVAYSKITEHRGNKRIWLEGLRLNECGFEKGITYSTDIDQDNKTITLLVDPEGNKRVSGRKRKGQETYTPIIDLCNTAITEFVEGTTRIRATFSESQIVITIHHEDIAKADREARTLNNLKSGKLTEGALCAGAAIASASLHQGLTDNNIESSIEWIVDAESKYLQVAIDNNPAITDDTQIFNATLEEMEPELLCSVDVLQVSLPCTGHSKAGKSKNKISIAEQHPTDATAVIGLLNIIKTVNPSIIVSENVPEAATSGSYALVIGRLKQLGYTIHSKVMSEIDAGSLEARKRWWFVAISNGLKGFSFDDINPLKKVYSCLGQIMEPVPFDDKSWAANQYLKDKAVKDKAAGKGFARQIVSAVTKSVGTIGRHYNKRRSTEPFIAHPDGVKERLLTPVEHARVKGIPEVFCNNLPATTAHECLGQSVLWSHPLVIGRQLALITKD